MVAMGAFWMGTLFLLIIAIVYGFPRPHQTNREMTTAMLERRFARGEMSEAEFVQARQATHRR